MYNRLLQFFGLGFIFLFSAVCIFLSLMERELPPGSELKSLSTMTTFFESRFYDLRMKLTMDPEAYDDRLVLAAIDDKSISEVGVWPFPRSIWTELLDKLDHYGAKVVAFDVFFSESSLACSQDNPDEEFAKAISRFQTDPNQKVILPYSLSGANDAYEEIPPIMYNFIMDTRQQQGNQLIPAQIGSRVFPLELLTESEPGLGIIQTREDPDGIFRHYPLLANVDELYFPSFSLLTYQYFTDDRPIFEMTSMADPKLKVETGELSLNILGESKVRWFGDMDNFPSVSIIDILKASDDDPQMRQILEDNIIFIGSTAFGAHDLRHTPVDSKLPGVYFHMNMTQMLLDGNFFRPVSESTKYSWYMLFGATILMILIMLLNNPILDLFSVATITIGLFLLDTYYLLPHGYEIKLFFCLFSVVACYSWSTFLEFYATAKEKEQIRGTFSSFVSPAIVDQMLKNPELAKVGGEKKNITVFFSDIRDFTSISERLTPEELSISLNQYMGVMTDIIFENYGTLDKYIGDAIVAFWGAPVALPNDHHAYHALRAAVKMIEALPAVNDKFREQGFPELKHGIGLNTGDCSVGNMGSDKIFSYTALGDHMNLGARIESLCKFYGVELNVSEYTIDALTDEQRSEFKYRMLDKVKVKGKEKPVTIYEVFHSTHPFYLDEQAHQDYNRAFEAYLAQDFKQAIEILKPLTEKYPEDKSCARVLKSCEEFIKFPPPPDWDGVFTHTSK